MMVSEKFQFDQASVDALQPKEKEWVAWDESSPGFGVRILPSGTKSWIVSARTTREDGKVRRRRIRIARCADMNLEEARAAARKILGEAVSEGSEEAAIESLAAEGVDKPASQDGAEPERAAGPPPNDAAVEETPDAGDGAGTGAVAVTPSGDRYDTETGVILSEGEGKYEDPDGDLGDLEGGGQGPDAGRDPEAGPGGEADAARENEALAGAVEKVTGSGSTDRYGEVAESAGRADRSGMLRVETGSGTGAERGRDAPGEAEAAGEHADTGVEDGDSGARDGGEGEERASETETTAPEPGMARRGLDIAKGLAGSAVKRGWEMASGSRKGSPAGEVRGEAAGDEPEAAPPSGGVNGTDEEDGSEGSGQPKLDARTRGNAEAQEGIKAGKALSEDTVAGLSENLDGIRGVVDRIEAWNAKMAPQMEMLSGSTAVIAVDRRRGRRRVARTALAAAALALVCFAGGAAVENRLPFLPLPDPTLGWKDHIWELYSSDIKTCFRAAKKTETGRVRCTMEVRAW